MSVIHKRYMITIPSHSNYKPQLDGIRAIAVIMVILSHWITSVDLIATGGPIGVQLFFILSGYLITGILLNASPPINLNFSEKRTVLLSFYARRFLRIFPLYYLVLLIMFVLKAPNVIEYFFWHLSYTTNVQIALKASWIGEASHLWTLAVEEQFYLLWPFVILFTPRRHLIYVIIAFILSSPIFKIMYGLMGNGLIISVIPICSFHSLGAGALLSVLEKTNKNNILSFLSRLSLAGLSAYIILYAFGKYDYFFGVAADISLTLFMTGLIYKASKGFNGKFGTLLSSAPLLYLGKISYGIYLLHNFVPYINKKFFNILGYNAKEVLGTYGYFCLNSLTLILLSSLFWFYFEKKINHYKKNFPYVRERKLVANG